MKKILVLIVFAFFCIKAQAQTSNGERLIEIETEIKAALVLEDYGKANLLKQEKTIRLKIKAAVESGNFDEAQRLKNSLNKEPSPGSVAAQIQVSGAGTITLVFSKLSAKQKMLQYDIVLDGEYVGALNLEEDVVVTNVSTGDHKIELFNPARPNNEKFSFVSHETISEAGTYSFDFNDASLKELMSLMKQNQKSYKQGNKKDIKLYNLKKNDSEQTNNSESQEFTSLTFPSKGKTEATFSYGKITTNMNWMTMELPEDATQKIKFSLGFESTAPISEENGFIAGGGLGFTTLYYTTSFSTIENWGANVFGSLGYQLEATPKVTLQALLKAGPSWSLAVAEPENTSAFGFGGSMNLGGLLFFNESQKSGISAELNIGFTGGVGVTVGWVGGSLKRKYRHKLYQQ